MTLQRLSLIFAVLAAAPAAAEMEPFTVDLPPYEVARTANDDFGVSYGQAVSALRYEPKVDVQERNSPEAQGDVTIRGGIFENTGLELAGVALVDPQTGHYLTELPLPASFLTSVKVRTGADHALAAANATAGSLAWELGAPYRNEAFAAYGEDDTWVAELTAALPLSGHVRAPRAQVHYGFSESAGTIPGGDHRFERFATRLRHRWGGDHETDVAAGYQAKFFAWPYLYALKPLHDLVGSSGIETENLQTRLFLVSHRWRYEGGDIRATLAHRVHTDDYEFDRARPGLFNPYQHETVVTALALAGEHRLGEAWALQWRGQAWADEIESTALTAGTFRKRNYLNGSLAAEWRPSGRVSALAGLRGAATDQDTGHVGPVARLGFDGGAWEVAAEYTETSQVPGYTALNSSATGGLFRGNPNLRPEVARTGELSAAWFRGDLDLRAAVFHREQRDLTDWVFDPSIQPYAARAARNLDVDTTGVELAAGWKWRAGPADGTVVASYAFLEKESDLPASGASASFYALNFPRHRATLAVIAKLGAALEIRADHEYRVQEDNPLRVGETEPLLATVSVVWRVAQSRQGSGKVELSATVHNLYDVAFEEVPGTPGNRRQASLGLRLRW